MGVIGLITDFGLNDNYVGVMKGVILNINPDAKIVDITHNIKSGDILTAGFILMGSYRYFPKDTVHLVVVDPGVGTDRKAVIIRTKNYYLVGPDNGVLSLTAEKDGIVDVYNIENKEYLLSPVSDTFHGRDVFAPVCAYLSKGRELGSFGPKYSGRLQQISFPKVTVKGRSIIGEIVFIDKFGNLITNIKTEDLLNTFGRYKLSEIWVRLKGTKIKGMSTSYQSVSLHKPLAIIGSFGNLEVALNGASAKALFKADIGLKVEVGYEKNGISR